MPLLPEGLPFDELRNFYIGTTPEGRVEIETYLRMNIKSLPTAELTLLRWLRMRDSGLFKNTWTLAT